MRAQNGSLPAPQLSKLELHAVKVREILSGKKQQFIEKIKKKKKKPVRKTTNSRITCCELILKIRLCTMELHLEMNNLFLVSEFSKCYVDRVTKDVDN